MHDIFKKDHTISDVSSGPYLFPEILKNAAPAREKDSESPAGAFQRIFIDVEPAREAAGDNGGATSASLPEPVMTPEDYKKILDELAQTYQQKEVDAYQRGFQEGQDAGYAKGRSEGYTSGQNDGYTRGQADGHAKGYETGAAETRQSLEPTLHMLETAAQALRGLQKEIELKTEKEIVTLSMAIARKVIHQEPSINPEMLVHTIQNALMAVTVHAPLLIRIHPSEAALIAGYRDQLPVEGEVSFVADAAITPGGCVIEGASGDIDARIETQMRIIEDAFAPRLEKIGVELAESI